MPRPVRLAPPAAGLLAACLLLPACTPSDSVELVETDSGATADDFGPAPGSGNIQPAAAESIVVGKAAAAAPLTHEDWFTDVAAAQRVARDDGKDLLMLFTGSDWCHWCQVLDKEVFAEAPASRIKDRFVLVMLDFPNDTSGMSADTVAQNELWAERMQIEGYPTVILADPDGEEYARTGYQRGGATEYVAHLEELAADNGRG